MKDTKKETKLVPKLRFKEFEGEWKTNSFESLRDTSVRWSITGGPFGSDLKSKDYTPNGVQVIQLQNIGDGYFIDESKIYTSKEKADKLLSSNIFPGDILLSKMGDPVARACIIPSNENRYVMCSDGIRLVVDKSKFNDYFVYSYINAIPFRKVAISRSTGSTRKRIGLSDLKSITLKTPSLPEQQKIASFLTAVDKRIEQLTKKKKLLEEYKKGVMQKIFNQEIRFKDENGNDFPEWEEKRLGEICKITTGKLDANAMIENGKYRFYTCASEYYKIDDYAFDTEALIISGNGANVGYIHYYKGKFNAYQRTYVLDKFTENIQYIKIFLDYNLPKRIDLEKKASNTPYIVLSTLADMDIKLPSTEEQRKLSKYILDLEKHLSRIEREKSLITIFKKGLLQQMFI